MRLRQLRRRSQPASLTPDARGAARGRRARAPTVRVTDGRDAAGDLRVAPARSCCCRRASRRSRPTRSGPCCATSCCTCGGATGPASSARSCSAPSSGSTPRCGGRWSSYTSVANRSSISSSWRARRRGAPTWTRCCSLPTRPTRRVRPSRSCGGGTWPSRLRQLSKEPHMTRLRLVSAFAVLLLVVTGTAAAVLSALPLDLPALGLQGGDRARGPAGGVAAGRRPRRGRGAGVGSAGLSAARARSSPSADVTERAGRSTRAAAATRSTWPSAPPALEPPGRGHEDPPGTADGDSARRTRDRGADRLRS